MSGRYFLDTNVLVYAFDQTSPAKARIARELIRSGIEKAQAAISYQVAQEFLNLALRKFTKPMNVSDAEQVFDSMIAPLLSVHSSARLFGEALRVAGRYKIAWYDALLVAGALEAGASILYTEDLQDGLRIGDLKIENPFP